MGLKFIKLEMTTLLKQYQAYFALRIMWGTSSHLQTPALCAPADSLLFPHIAFGTFLSRRLQIPNLIPLSCSRSLPDACGWPDLLPPACTPTATCGRGEEEGIQ